MMRNLADKFAEFLNEPVAVLCCRYWYRGIVTEVGSDHVTLSNPRAVEITGSASQSAPQQEDPIPSDLTFALGAVEQFCQPTWCYHGYKGENEKKKKKKASK